MASGLTFIVSSVTETKRLAARLALCLQAGDVILLDGDLGAGKTTFVSGALQALGHKGRVISPTFNILKCYFDLTPPVFHIDAYRLEDHDPDIGLDEFIGGSGVTFIEWPRFLAPLLPSEHLRITFRRLSSRRRELVFTPTSAHYRLLLERSMQDHDPRAS